MKTSPAKKAAAKTNAKAAAVKKVAAVEKKTAAPAAPDKAAAPAAPVVPQPKRRATVVKGKGTTAPAAPAPADQPNPADAAKAAAFFKAQEEKQAAGKTAKASGEKTVKTKAVKVEKKIVPFVPKRLEKGKVPFVIAIGPRPSSGTRLFAHTHAALTMLGMLDDKLPIVPKAAVLTIMGARALKYHLDQGNFADAKDHGVQLTTAGLNNFRNRMAEGKVDGKLANEYLNLFLTGDPGETGVKKGEIYAAPIGL